MKAASSLRIQVRNENELREALFTAENQIPESADRVEIDVIGTIFMEDTPELCHNKVPVVIRGTNAVLDGGYRIKGFAPTTVNGTAALRAEIDPARAESLLFDQLFVNGGRRYRPIFPENERGFNGLVKEKGGLRRMIGADWITANSIFQYNGRLPEFSRVEDIEFHVSHCWLHERMKAAKIDFKHNRVYTETSTRFCVLEHECSALVNVFEMLKQPGQYYFDKRASAIYYIPKEGETADTIEAVIPVSDRLLQLTGAANVSIQGLTFRYVSGRCGYKARLRRDGRKTALTTLTQQQSECEMGGCIGFTDCADCEITGCTFEHIGVYGVDINSSGKNIRVSGCSFCDLGSGALKTQTDDKRGVTITGVRFTDNKVNGYGKAYRAACAVLLTHVSDSAADNNEIEDGEYTAISLGWTWGYRNTGYINNSVCGNHLHDIGKNRLDDMSAIYTLGIQPFTRIAGNRIHGLTSPTGVCFGIYLDEGSSCMTVENNLICQINGDAFHIHYGRDNLFRRNICADCTGGLISVTRREPHVQVYAEYNVFHNASGHMIRVNKHTGDGTGLISDRNLYSAGGAAPCFSFGAFLPDETYVPLDRWRTDTRNDSGSMAEDPLFVNAAEGDYRLREHSPAAEALGFASSEWIVTGK